MPATARYTRTAVVLHWVVAAMLLVQYPLGWLMQQIPKDPPGQRANIFNVHKSIGFVILALMVARLAWRLGHPAPALPAMPRWQAGLARATHAALYVVLLALPLSGYLGSVFSGYPVKFFGVVLPAWGAKNVQLKDLMSTVHLALGWVLATGFVLHMAGVVKHAWLDRDGLLRRMTWRGEAPRDAASAGHLRDA